ncbi:MAG TPA: alpha/beta fold hydrolase [Geminicoccaceae bacterium]|nr:alpha/beta fold hydrolase [Geminicoccaceae bacterium]
MRLLVVLAALLLLAACSTPPLPSPTAGGGPGAAVPTLRWEPEGVPRARVLALHGFNDHKASFAEFGAFAAEHGVLVEAYDQSGFGERDNAGLWPGLPALVAELEGAIGRLRTEQPKAPLFVLGESMGAAIAVVALAAPDALAVDGLILSAPAVWGGDTLNPFYRALLWVMVRVAPGLQLTGRDLGILASDNLEMLRALGADPLYIKATRVDAIAGLVAVMDAARAAGPELRGPLLVLTGVRDEVVTPDIQSSFVATLRAPECLHVDYPEGWHLLLRDLGRRVVWEDVLAWTEGRPLPWGLGRPCASAAEVAAASGR